MNEKAPLPGGDYCIVELFGHVTLVGRYKEVEQFGTKMMAIEPLFQDTLLPAVFHGGAVNRRPAMRAGDRPEVSAEGGLSTASSHQGNRAGGVASGRNIIPGL